MLRSGSDSMVEDLEASKCPKCGSKIHENTQFCQKCGYNFAPVKESDWKAATIKPKTKNGKSLHKRIDLEPLKRKCTGCGTIVISKVLEQCPECYEMLPSLPEVYKKALQAKMDPEAKRKKELELEIEKDKWNAKEAVQVFMNSVLIYIVFQALIMGIYILINPDLLEDPMSATIPIDATSLILSNLAGLAFIIYPIYYLVKNKHVMKKLGIKKENVKKCLLFGSAIGIGYYFLEFFIEFLLDFIASLGIEWLNPPEILTEQSVVVTNMPWYLLIIFTSTLVLSQIAEAMVFRGVLHNGIGSYFTRKESSGKIWKSILLSAVCYAVVFFVLNFNIYYLIFNLLSALFVGAVYEYSNRNLYAIIAMQTSYTILSVILFILI